MKLSILTGYSGCDEMTIRKMSKKELCDAIIRVFSVKAHKFNKSDSMRGEFLLEDELADAFRNKI